MFFELNSVEVFITFGVVLAVESETLDSDLVCFFFRITFIYEGDSEAEWQVEHGSNVVVIFHGVKSFLLMSVGLFWA